ncbi:MoaD/ThiS family protein [Parachitinimonas caeni]|uniref:MoaD/ThiS family protein n=1 Tax=Parachitinimonas caeni TaxID=3031301 RepID=A0ABT7DW95_9NEIS|nr:MoaD/ThiS family protein [Parachitinimonas caeni]MDK2123383.1 MoaD/ThiS family protein [Parachitinimonas caeni]
MPTIAFTHHLQRHAPAHTVAVDANSVAAALNLVFAAYPALRGYVMDEHSHLRRHVAVFVNGAMLRRGDVLSNPIPPDAEIYVMQALSGG